MNEKQQDCHKHLKEECKIDTIVGCIYEDIIIEMHDHYKTVFAKAQTTAIQDKANAYNFAKSETHDIGATGLVTNRHCRNVKKGILQ